MRTLLHFGLAALLVLAPAFCCCNVRLFTGRVAASPADGLASTPAPSDPAPPACCHARTPTAQVKACCHEAEPAPNPGDSTRPAAPPAPACKCLGERPDAAPPESMPVVADPDPTGELLPLATLGLVGLSPEHLGLIGGLRPPERAGVDARSAALFDRHVLRC